MAISYITWNTGGFSRDDWKILFDLIVSRNIRSVLEYGCGVSTELMRAVGIDVVSLETQEEYLVDGAILCTYPNFPEFNRRFDLCFIDGPGAREFEVAGKKPERKYSAIHATRYSNLIFLHDAGLGQEEILSGWKTIRSGDRDIIYELCDNPDI